MRGPLKFALLMGGSPFATAARALSREDYQMPPKTSKTWQTNGIELTPPTPGNSVTLLNKAGAGIVWAIYLVTSYGDLWKHGRIQVFTDGEVLPSVDFDLATVFGTGYDGTAATYSLSNDRISTAPVTGANSRWSGEIRIPIPYSNGCIIKLFSPVGMSTSGGFNSYFFQVAGEDGVPSDWANYRLKSVNVPVLNAVSYLSTDQIVWIDKPNCAGSIALLAQACQGVNPAGGQQDYGFLERQQWFAIDGESSTPDGNGAINTSFASSGGEDWYSCGWYFASTLTRFQASDVLVTAANNANRTACMSLDFLKRHGGVRFNSSIKGGWSRKDGATGNGLMNGHADAFTILYYVDKSVPFAPSSPQSVTSLGVNSGTATWGWTRPKSDGSDFLTGYKLVPVLAGVEQTGLAVTVAANVLQATATGLTNGSAYTANIYALNSVGASTAAAGASQTPASSTVPDAPTIGTATAGNGSASVAFTPPGFNGGSAILDYTVTSSPGGFTATGAASPIIVPGLANGTAYTFTVKARNANGQSAASSASNSVTPGATTLSEDTFVRANSAVVGSAAPTGGQTWAQARGTNSPNIVSNAAKCNTSEANNHNQAAVVNVGQADMRVEMTANVPSGNYNWGPVARFVSDGVQISASVNQGAVSLYVNDVQRGSSASVTVGTSSHTIALDVHNNGSGSADVNVYWDGVLKITYTLTSPEFTSVGGGIKGGFSFYKASGAIGESGTTQVTDLKITN